MKKRSWRLALHLISLCVIWTMTSQAGAAGCAQPVKIIVPYPPGGPDDIIARILAQKLSEVGDRFYVENMPGATGMVGTAAAARAAPDGCTMVVVNQNFVTQPAVAAKTPYDVPDGFSPVTLLLAAPETISVNPSLQASTMKDLISLAKASPGKYNYASPGYGSSPHLAGERLFRRTLGLDIVHVPFTGGPRPLTRRWRGIHRFWPSLCRSSRYSSKIRSFGCWPSPIRPALQSFLACRPWRMQAYQATRSGFGTEYCCPRGRLGPLLSRHSGKSLRS